MRARKNSFSGRSAAGLPDIRLEGFRILLRPPGLQDWAAWAEARGRNRDFLKPWEPSWAPDSLSREFYIRRLQAQIRNWQEDTAQAFLIFRKEDGALTGGMNINHICRGAAQHASLGYWIDEGCQGQGYMSEALRLTVHYCFRSLGLERVHAACLPDNARSRNLLARAGFREEGFAENYMQIDGARRDHVLYGLTRERGEAEKNPEKPGTA